MAADPPAPYFQTQHIQDNTTVVVFSTVRAGAMVTTVMDGPLHEAEEVVTQDITPARLREQHHKWVWRVLNADLTHPEWFRARRRRGRPTP